MAAEVAGKVPAGVHFHFHGEFRPWHPNRFLARLQDWREFSSWTNGALPVADRLHREIGFDVVHHVTYSTWRIASPLWQLPIPFVWGPVGGGGWMPSRFHSTLSVTGRSFEIVRSLSGLARFSPSLCRCAKGAAHIFASCADTKRLLASMRGSDDAISILSPGFFSPEQIARYSELRRSERTGEVLQIFTGGNIIGSKGCALALYAVARAKAAGLRFQYTIAGGGPEEAYLRNLASKLGLAEVLFVPAYKGAEYLQKIRETDIYLFPSFRENIGLTMMEAMLAGAVPIVLDRSAPGEIVTPECGVKLRADSVSQVIEDMSAAVLRLGTAPELRARLGESAVHRIESDFGEDHYRREVSRIYQNVVKP
jgi:glycosyltransferase involved in cell wall biosynthesis